MTDSAATTAEWLDALQARLEAETTEDWQYAYKRTSRREYAARQALYALNDLRARLSEFDAECIGTVYHEVKP